MATKKKEAGSSKAAKTAKKEETKKKDTPKAPEEKAPKEQDEQPKDGGANEVAPYNIAPDDQTEEQKAYVTEFNRYLELHGGFPDKGLSLEDLKEANEKKESENAQPPKTQDTPATTGTKSKTKDSSKYLTIRNKKNKETRRIKRVTWNLLKKAPGDFEEVSEVPREVEQLKQSKGGK